jgi:hypothetical protein
MASAYRGHGSSDDSRVDLVGCLVGHGTVP